MLQLAESYFQIGDTDKAAPFYEQLALQAEPGIFEQAIYRLAEIDLRTDQRQAAAKRLAELSQRGKNPLWVKMAKEELDILQLPTDK